MGSKRTIPVNFPVSVSPSRKYEYPEFSWEETRRPKRSGEPAHTGADHDHMMVTLLHGVDFLVLLVN